MKKLSIIICVLMSVLATYATDFPRVAEQVQAGYFPLATPEAAASICTDANDFTVVNITAKMLADDVERVTGCRPSLNHQLPQRPAIVAGTLGKSRLIDGMVKRLKLDVSAIRGKWEAFMIQTAEHPKYHTPLLIIVGSWSDDKHGYCRNLCNPQEQQRKGGAGIYYHLSYHGDPASWIWLSPLSPVFLSTELTKVYTFGARKIWVFNVGDIKPAEKEISFVMELAWDISRWKLPTLRVYEGRDARFAVQLGNSKPQVFSIHAGDFTAEWRWNVLRGYASRSITIPNACKGKQKFRIYYLDPGIVLQEVLVFPN